MIKFTDEFIEEIQKRREIQVPENYVTGENFEKYLRKKDKEKEKTCEYRLVQDKDQRNAK